MKLTKLKAIAAGTGVALLALITTPAQAGSVAVTDGSGVDFDAMCIAQIPPAGLAPLPAPPAANSYASPGGTGCGGGTVSLYDGNTESTDVNTFSLGNGPRANSLTATCDLDSPLPPAGNTNRTNPNLKMPNDAANIFVGVGCKVMFQVPRTQNLTPTANGGCPRFPTGTVFDQHDHWKDGSHYFIGYDATYDGTKWVHSAQIGEYDPAPDGGFFFTELGTSSSVGVWADAITTMPNPGTWSASHDPTTGTVTVTVNTQVVTPDTTNCANGEFVTDYAATGDAIQDVKVLSTADATVTLPVTVPLSLTCSLPGGAVCESDLTSVGGFIFFSDTSEGASTAGSFRTNIRNIAYSGGLIGLTDTLGDGPFCPTPTFGGTLPPNPLTNPPLNLANPQADGCQIDDDMIPGQRGALLTEWWETAADFVL